MSKIVDRIFNTVLTADDSTAQEELGAFRFENGKIYKYVQFQDAVTAAAGAPCVMDGTYNHKVTVDLSLGITDCPAGVSLTANTATYYGWIQTYGTATVKVTDYVTAGDYLLPSADNFWGLVTRVIKDATGTAALDITISGHVAGAMALATSGTDVNSTITAFIRCM